MAHLRSLILMPGLLRAPTLVLDLRTQISEHKLGPCKSCGLAGAAHTTALNAWLAGCMTLSHARAFAVWQAAMPD